MIHSYFKDCFLTITKKSFPKGERFFLFMYLPVILHGSERNSACIVRLLSVYCA